MNKSPKYSHFLQVVVLLGVLLVLNLLAGFKFFRLDLTEDKIHSLSPTTKDFLTNEEYDIINVEVYLTGNDLPPAIQKFKRKIKDKIQEFQAFTSNKLKVVFIDIQKDSLTFNDKMDDFSKAKVTPNLMVTQENGAQKDYEFYPIAQFRHRSYLYHIDFMPDVPMNMPITEAYVERQEAMIEYRMLTAIHQVIGKPRPTLSFLRGHNELTEPQMKSTVLSLETFYNVDCVYIAQVESVKRYLYRNEMDKWAYINEAGYASLEAPNLQERLNASSLQENGNFVVKSPEGIDFEFDTLTLSDTNALVFNYKEIINVREKLDALENTDILVINKPKRPFSEKEMFIIDQFIMKGGKTVWNMDMINPHEDSLFFPIGYTYSTTNDFLDKTEEMLYKYGAGIKKNFISNEVAASQFRHDLRYRMGNENKPIRLPQTPSYYTDKNGSKLAIEPLIKSWYPFACVTKTNLDITENIGRVKLQYPSEININTGAPAKAEVILESDPIYKEFPGVTRIYYDKNFILNDISNRGEISGDYYNPNVGFVDPNNKPKPLGVLLKGKFNSFFNINQFSSEFVNGMKESGIVFKEKIDSNAMAIIGDGDLLADELLLLQTGYIHHNVNNDYLTPYNVSYGNSLFFHNLIDKMVGNDHLIPLRSRVQVLRKLDADNAFYNRSFWQMINLYLPIVLVLLLVVAQWFIRKNQFTKK